MNSINTDSSHSDYVFFGSYLQPPPKEGQGLWSDVEETERVNVALLSNFLSSLKIAEKLPKRFLLQTGGKHYGVHIGPTLTPQEEEDPRYLKERNFYFPQEDLLWKWCADNGVEWNVTRPGFIMGAVKETAMSIAHGLALYASIQAELGQPLAFPGDIGAWEAEKHISSALLIAYHAEWTVLTPKAANQALNITDGGLHTYGKFWPILADIYGIPYGIPEPDESKYQTITMPIAPPPRGFGPAGQIRASGSIEAWAQKPEVQEAWKRLKQKHGLTNKPDPFDKPKDIFGLLDGELLGPWGRSMSMEKSRKLGWNGVISSTDGLIKTFKEMADLKMVPPMVKKLEDVNVSYVGY
jgi:hypothetical protein